jgi:hypothetical protein
LFVGRKVRHEDTTSTTAKNPALDTIAHESGHAAGDTRDIEGGSHSSDPDNLMSPGSKRHVGAPLSRIR